MVNTGDTMTSYPIRLHARAVISSATQASSDRRLLAVLKERKRFVRFLEWLEQEPENAPYRLYEGIGMARGLARQARHCAEALQAAGNTRAATTLVELLKGDFDLAESITGGKITAAAPVANGAKPGIEEGGRA